MTMLPLLIVFLATISCSRLPTKQNQNISMIIDQSKNFRFNLKLKEAEAALAKVNIQLLSDGQKIDFALETIFMAFEKYGGESAALKLRNFELDLLKSPLKNDNQLRQTLAMIKIYLHPHEPRVSNLSKINVILENYRRSYEKEKPSLLYWPHITKAKFLRRASLYKEALTELNLAKSVFDLKKPNLDREILKYQFEKTVLATLLGEKGVAIKSLDQYLESVSRYHLPNPYVDLANQLKYLILEQRSKFSLLDYISAKTAFGPGHYTQEALHFLERKKFNGINFKLQNSSSSQ